MIKRKITKSIDGFRIRNPVRGVHLPDLEKLSSLGLDNQNPNIVLDRAMVARERSGWRDLFSTIGILLTAFIFAILMISFVFRTYQVDGQSMQSTLMDSDKLIIWKVPRTIASITRNAYIPNRGDVVVFNESAQGLNCQSGYGDGSSKQLIKRVIGLPGDRVQVKDNMYTVYNASRPNGFNPDKTLPYGKNIGVTGDDGDWTVGKDQLFVSGDNRANSKDSRCFGPIDASQIVGKLVLRVFPLSKTTIF